jgi:hypothetical protein
MTGLLPPIAFAADPTAGTAPGPATGHDRNQPPLTRAQLGALAIRERQASRVAASFTKAGEVDGSLCPTSPVTAARLAAVSPGPVVLDGARSSPDAVAAAISGSGSCVSDFIAVYARQQVKWFYCGPATVQQVINYTRGIFTADNSVNAFSQQQISDRWLKTDLNGGTSPSAERAGMNSGSRLPTGFGYAEYQVVSGPDWHSKVITDITGWGMPLTAAVAPHDANFTYFLTSWAGGSPVNTGHWIVIRGYYGKWDGTRNPLVYYTDSSGGLGGSTGRFYDPSFDVYQTLLKTNAVHTQGRWIVW